MLTSSSSATFLTAMSTMGSQGLTQGVTNSERRSLLNTRNGLFYDRTRDRDAPDAFRNRSNISMIDDDSNQSPKARNSDVRSVSGSMVSRSATLRNRNRIKSRNKMVHRDSLKKDKEKPKKSPNRIAFNFPVKRKSSLKRKPDHMRFPQKPANFESYSDFASFYEQANAANLIREMAPQLMLSFKYRNLLSPEPKLLREYREFEINLKNDFLLKDKAAQSKSKITISDPLKSTLTKNGMQFDSPVGKASDINFIDVVFNKYRNTAFANKLIGVPDFQTLFPDEPLDYVVSEEDIKNMNARLAYEVLLRRTVAAKLEFRLRQYGFATSSESAWSTSDSNRPSYHDDEDDEYNSSDYSSETPSDRSSFDEPYSSPDFMRYNFSAGLLPSPQISPLPETVESWYNSSDISGQKSLGNSKDNSSNYSSPELNSTNFDRFAGNPTHTNHGEGSPSQSHHSLFYENPFTSHDDQSGEARFKSSDDKGASGPQKSEATKKANTLNVRGVETKHGNSSNTKLKDSGVSPSKYSSMSSDSSSPYPSSFHSSSNSDKSFKEFMKSLGYYPEKKFEPPSPLLTQNIRNRMPLQNYAEVKSMTASISNAENSSEESSSISNKRASHYSTRQSLDPIEERKHRQLF
ncbi:Piso0_001325 [Millerozyma farinosa CBS 7064]|uniref:Piso0_001325 protein n=1 Tax=Pichia sorbitophila (strain ATCC MYA-4447 / BCRC 22081 / CBS 7064 / NBRC 10061 / NRRL Y-12695) TaxID=559304 RepID=G8YMV3_PICSO|nr:Piso0_001325 [Millerozyma farinosa CBS 7064]